MSSIVINFLSWLFSKFSFLIPRAFKKLVIISTLCSKGIEEKVFTNVDYAQLIKRMNLASSFEAVESASCLQNFIWKDVKLSDLMRDPQMHEFAGEQVPYPIELSGATQRIIDTLPSWVRYNRRSMEEDVRALLMSGHVSMDFKEA